MKKLRARSTAGKKIVSVRLELSMDGWRWGTRPVKGREPRRGRQRAGTEGPCEPHGKSGLYPKSTAAP